MTARKHAKIVPRKPAPAAPVVATVQAPFETVAAEARAILVNTYGEDYAAFYGAMRAREAMVFALRDAEYVSYADQQVFYSK